MKPKPKLKEIFINGQRLLTEAVCITLPELVVIANGPTATTRRHHPPAMYYGKSIGGGKLFRFESVHLEDKMTFTVNRGI